MQTYTVGNYSVDAETPEEAILLLAKQIKNHGLLAVTLQYSFQPIPVNDNRSSL